MTHKSVESSRSSTGVEGLDEILGGGLPCDRLYLVQGDPGVGKTTLSLQFLLEGVRQGEAGLYIALSETREELDAVAQSHGWTLDAISVFELSSIQAALQGETESTFFHPSEVELDRTTQAVLDEIERVKPRRVVFDSLSEMRMLAEAPLRYRRQILRLKQYFAGKKCTILMLDDRSAARQDLQLESIAHGVLDLHRSSPGYGVAQRFLNVRKIRGVGFREGNHDFILRKGGMIVFPRLVAAEHHVDFESESFSSGIPELDALLGGGLDRGTSNMFMGPPGTGKSTLALKFAFEAARWGEKVFFTIFDETRRTLISRSAQLGMDIEPYIKNGTILLDQVDPAEISPGELTYRIRCSIAEHQTRMVIIDSINGYINAMPGERYLNLQLHELLAYLNQQGVITIMVLAQQGLIGTIQATVDLTYLADTVLLLRYFENCGAVKQAISIIKKRSGNHERSIREIRVGRSGFEVGPPLKDLQGVLTGVPSFRPPELKAEGLDEHGA